MHIDSFEIFRQGRYIASSGFRFALVFDFLIPYFIMLKVSRVFWRTSGVFNRMAQAWILFGRPLLL